MQEIISLSLTGPKCRGKKREIKAAARRENMTMSKFLLECYEQRAERETTEAVKDAR